MSKLDILTDGRNQGMVFALKIASEAKQAGHDPILALQREIEFRKLTKLKVCATMKELDDASEVIKALTIKTMLAASMVTLWERFGFGKKRLLRFRDGFMTYVAALSEQSITWFDVTDSLKDATGIEIDLTDADIAGKGEGK